MTKSRALITGITGQDGSYLSELLLSKGYEEVLGWAPETHFRALVREMVDADCATAESAGLKAYA